MLVAHSVAAVRAAEEPLLEASPPGALMAHAAFALATQVVRELRTGRARISGASVLALVGGGNNGGDALHAAGFLARRGASVTAALLTRSPHADGVAAARAAGVRLVQASAGVVGPDVVRGLAVSADVWIDGLAGIGVVGGLREPLASTVRALVDLRAREPRGRLVVAVDTPSGIGVDDGTVPGPVLPADLTVTMGAYKPGLLLPPASAFAGEVRLVDIGLGPALRPRGGEVVRLTGADVAGLWPVPRSGSHKYERGVLGLLAGSPRYPGAGVLAAAGAAATGVGMIRYLGDQSVLRLVHTAQPEVVGTAGRVQAWALGSGVDPADGATLGKVSDCLRAALQDGLPAVLDAGALALLGVQGDLPGLLPPTVVLTPHAGELSVLLAARGVSGDDGAATRAAVEAAPARWARAAARATGATVLLKGSTTVVAAPDGPIYAQADATDWLATAGSGDVLTGVLGALMSGRSDDLRAAPGLAARLAAAASLVHGRAARLAARLPPSAATNPFAPGRAGGAPIAAGDVARAVPATVAAILAGPTPPSGLRTSGAREGEDRA